MRWNQLTKEAKEGMFNVWNDGRGRDVVEEFANHYGMNPDTLVRRFQEMAHTEYSEKSEVFPDKKKHTISFESVINQIRQVQGYKEAKAVSQEEATWIPRREYSDLPIAITWMSDVHFGSLHTDYEMLKNHLDIIRNTPNMYLITGGDEIDNFNAIKYADGIWTDGVSPEDQMLAWANLLGELDAEEKIGAVVWGNHTQFSNAAGIDPYSAFFSQISAPLFVDGGGVLNVVLGSIRYRLGIRHTFWGGSKLNVTNSPKRMIQFGYPNLDVAMVAHVHDAAGEMFTLAGEEKIAIVGGTYKMNDTFRKRWNGDPQAAGFTVVLYPDRKKMMLFRYPEDAQAFILGTIAYS